MLPSLKEITPREGTSIISKDISLSVEDGFADEAKLLIQNLKEMGYNVTDKGQTVIALCHFPQNMQAKKRRALPSRRKRQLHNHQWRNPARYFQRDSNPRLITQKTDYSR